MINDVRLKQLKKHTDRRGWFCEIIRETDPFFDHFGQWSFSLMYTGVIKAWHIHQVQYDYWFVPAGAVLAALCDLRPNSSTYKVVDEYLLGDGYDPLVVKIPPGVAHGCRVLQGPALLSYVTSTVYDPEDEGRMPFDTDMIRYDWLKQEIK